MAKLPSRPAFHVAPEVLRGSIARTEETVAKALAARPWVPANLRGLHLLTLSNAALRASIDLGDPGIAVDLERVACMGAALFGGLVAGAGQTIEAPLPGGGQTVEVTGSAPDSRVGEPGYWREALLAALTVRKTRAVSMLAEVPLALLRALGPTHDEWTFLEYEALQAVALGRPDAPVRLLAAAKAANPETVHEIVRDRVLDVVTPELQLAFKAIDRDQAGFDTWMIVAIEGHHHYFQRNALNKKQPTSQLALAPLAMACVAHDLGIRTNVTTDYLPRHIIEP